MSDHEPQLARRRTSAAYVCIGLALACVLLLGGWGAYRDLNHLRSTLFQAEIGQLRSHADRTVGHIENHLLEEGPDANLQTALEARWLRAYWNRVIPRQPERSYAAVVDLSGKILAHSDPRLEGGSLGEHWFDDRAALPDQDVHETESPLLAGGRRSFDIQVPIVVRGRPMGAYHAGLNAAWFADKVAEASTHATRGWVVVIGGITLVVLLATISLNHIIRRGAALRHKLELANARRVTERGQLVIGLVHEIRNPLNAIRLNLHVIERSHDSRSALPSEEIKAMLGECAREIERVEDLMRDILGYARVETRRSEVVDLNAETQATLGFLRQSFEQARTTIHDRLPAEAALVRMDRGRLRQILLNLLNNAREAVGEDGGIELALSRGRGWLELTVEDDGPGVPPTDRERIFEPFFTTQETGVGLGLAIVRKFVEEGGGQVCCEQGGKGGALFRVRLPEAAAAAKREGQT